MGVELVMLLALSLSAIEAENILEDEIILLKEEIIILQEELDEITPIFNQQNIDIAQASIEKSQLKAEQKETDITDLSKYHNVSTRLDAAKENYNKLKWKLYEIENKKESIEEKIDKLEIELEIKETTLEKLIKIQSSPTRYQNVGIVLSGVCISMIEHGNNKNCPTYSQLFENFDNTNPLVSGTFETTTNDIKRNDPQYENHWKWYEHKDYPTIVMVDPDVEFKNRNITIEIQSRGFYSFNLFENHKQAWDGRTITTFEDVKFSHDCKTIIVAPDMELINRVVGYAITGCQGEFEIDPNIKYIKKTQKPWTSPYPYDVWLESIKENYEKYMKD